MHRVPSGNLLKGAPSSVMVIQINASGFQERL